MAISKNHVGIERLEINGNLPWRVRSVNNRQYPCSSCAAADFIHGQTQRSWRSNMAQIYGCCVWGDT